MICPEQRLSWRGVRYLKLKFAEPRQENAMWTNGNASPLEHLAAFAIVFVTAVVGTTAMGKYLDKVRRDAGRA